jgi:uncharacterized protein (TIGR02757 family)
MGFSPKKKLRDLSVNLWVLRGKKNLVYIHNPRNKMTNKNDIRSLLESKYSQFNNPDFIETDPISIPHLFSKKEDIEIAAFLSATIAWGQRITILKNARMLMTLMEDEPHDFILNAKKTELDRFKKFVHRTFNGEDAVFFMNALKKIYLQHGGLENVMGQFPDDLGKSISHFRKTFLATGKTSRTHKHIADPLKNSSAKRICMFLRWMVRKDRSGVDFGIWKKIQPSQLYTPLDLHSGATARKLGLLTRKQDDWKSVVELTENLRKFDPKDPVKYDFALYGLGVFEKF